MALDPQQEAENDYSDLSEAPEYVAEMQTPELKHRRLMIAIADRLNKANLKAIACNVKVKLSSMQSKNPSAIGLLFELEGYQIFTSENMEPLRDILRAINRSDIVEDLLSKPLGSSLSRPMAVPSQATLESQETGRQELVTSTSVKYGKSWEVISCPSNIADLSITSRVQQHEKLNVSKKSTETGASDEIPVLLPANDKLIANGHSPTIQNLVAPKLDVTYSEERLSDGDSLPSDDGTNSSLARSAESSEIPESEDHMILSSGAISSKPHTLDRVETGKLILRHRVNKCINSQQWRIEFTRLLYSVTFKIKNEYYPYGLGEDENSHATVKMTITPSNIKNSSFFLYKHLITFFLTVVTDTNPLEELVVTAKKVVEVQASRNVELYFRLLEHSKHILKLRNKSFKVTAHAEVNARRINLTSEDIEDDFSNIFTSV